MRIRGRRGHRVAALCGLVVVALAGGFVASVAQAPAAASADATVEPSPVTAPTQRATTTPATTTPATTTPATTTPATTTPPATQPTVSITAAPPDTPVVAATETTVVLPATETTVAPPATDAAGAVEAIDVAAPVEATVATPDNRSSCRADLPGAVMTIAMPDISYLCPVYAGGQAVIDAGVATMITAQESSFPLAVHPGDAGTMWITGHRVSHGGPFAAVPDLGDGAIITVTDGTGTASYVIVGRSYVEIRNGLAVDASGQATESATLDAVLRPDRNGDLAPRLLLQTCDTENFRWMIYADLIEA